MLINKRAVKNELWFNHTLKLSILTWKANSSILLSGKKKIPEQVKLIITYRKKILNVSFF